MFQPPKPMGSTTAFGNYGSMTTQNNPNPTGNAPAPGGNFFGQPANPGSSLASMSAPTGPAISFDRHPFAYIQECLNPASSNYPFRFFFYNAVPGGMVSNAQTRSPLVSERLWTQVINDNPDPTKMVPVLANGFEDLTARRHWQNEHQEAQRAKLSELEQRLASLLTRQDLDVATQLQVIHKQQLKLTLRIIQMMRKVEVLRKSGQRLGGTEQALFGRLQSLTQHLAGPATSALSIQHMEKQLQSLAESDRLDPLSMARSLVVSDGGSIEALYALLKEQQNGLDALIKVVNKDGRDLDTMHHGFSSSLTYK